VASRPAGGAEGERARFGDYLLLGEIARGGMGVVYRARQLSLNRLVALKTILAAQHTSSIDVRRFHFEAEAAALLDHPHIVPIYEVGEVDGQHYFTMKLVEGGSLSSRLDEFRLPAGCGPAEAERRQTTIAELMATVSRAVHHAHLRGILHRDLKPGNILLQSPSDFHSPAVAGDDPQSPEMGHAAAGARPLVTDFGLAKRVDGRGGLTQSQTIVGTAAYMAPEQAMAQRGALTTATDVYGLGSILYELLTGRPPFLAGSFIDTAHLVVEEPPVPPHERNPRVTPDLEAICLKCLEKEPARRYGSALELAEDLERFAAGEAVSLRPLGRSERARRWMRQNRLVAALVGAVAALLVIITIGALAAAWWIARDRDLATQYAREVAILGDRERQEHAVAARARDQALAALEAQRQANLARDRLLVSGDVANGTHALDAGDASGALVWYGQALRRDAGDPAREEVHRVRLASVLRRCPKPIQMWFTPLAGPPPVLSPDGSRVLVVDRETASVSAVLTGAPSTPPLTHNSRIEHAAFSRDGRRVVTASADYTARVWDATTGAPVGAPLRHEKAVRFAAFRPDGRQVVTGSNDKTARIWDIPQDDHAGAAQGTPGAVAVLEHQQAVRYAAFSRDGRHLITISGELVPGQHELLVWDLATLAHPVPVRFPQKAILFVRWAVFSPDASLVVWQGSHLALRVWDYRGDPQRLPRRQAGPEFFNVRADPEGAMDADGTRVIEASGPSARIHELRTGHTVGPPLVHGDVIQLAALSPDGRLAVTAARDRTARVWDTATGAPVLPPLRHAQRVTHAWFNDDGSRLLTVSADGSAQAWDLSWHEPGPALVPMESRRPGAISADGTWTARVDDDGAVRVHDARTGQLRPGPWSLGQPVNHLIAAPDARRLLVVADTTARVWDVASAQPMTPLYSQAEPIVTARLSPDGRRLVTRGDAGPGRVWDLSGDDRPVDELIRLTRVLSGLALDPASGGIGLVETAQLRADWLRLRTNDPREFLPATP
jgi:serine/threonine protein kinase/WD40 repeat protein